MIVQVQQQEQRHWRQEVPTMQHLDDGTSLAHSTSCTIE
jgi:hypothetical protein